MAAQIGQMEQLQLFHLVLQMWHFQLLFRPVRPCGYLTIDARNIDASVQVTSVTGHVRTTTQALGQIFTPSAAGPGWSLLVL